MNFEIWRDGSLIESLNCSTEQAIARAWELRGLAYERRNPNWKESAHRSFSCSEADDGYLLIDTPVGVFQMQARRAEAGELIHDYTGSGGMIAFGTLAASNQESLPVRIYGRLNEPGIYGASWDFQPDHIEYADGTRTGYLGSYPKPIELRGEK